jgi:hypothetical protein
VTAATVFGCRAGCRRRQDGGVPSTPPAKACAACGRRIEWRRRWARDWWEQVRYCSAACRRRGLTDTDRRLERAILDLLAARPGPATICPSEAARAVGGDGWRDLVELEPARRAARRLVDTDAVEITQGGRVVDPSTARGPIRIRRRSR